jgi:hypothetical protein
MKNRRYESFQINRCDSKSNRSCIKNQMMMWWNEIQLTNQMIRSSDLLIFFKKTNVSNRFSIRYFINSFHHLNFYHCIASSIYLSTAYFAWVHLRAFRLMKIFVSWSQKETWFYCSIVDSWLVRSARSYFMSSRIYEFNLDSLDLLSDSHAENWIISKRVCNSSTIRHDLAFE